MKEYDAVETAFKNGYENGKSEVAKEIFKELDQELAYCLEAHPYAVSRYFEIRNKYTKRGKYESN